MAWAMSFVARIGGCVPSRSRIRPAMTSGLSGSRDRGVPGLPADGDLEAMEALLGDLDRVEAPRSYLDADAAGFGQAGIGLEEPRFVVDDPGDAPVAACLLVGGAGEDDVASQAGDRVAGRIEACGGCLAREPKHDLQFHGRHALHVHGAATVDVAVGDLAREGVVRPSLRVGRHDIEVSQEEERAPARAVAPEACDDVAAAWIRLQHDRLEARSHKHLGQVARGQDLVARRVHGLESDECLEVPHHLIEGCVGSGLAGALDG